MCCGKQENAKERLRISNSMVVQRHDTLHISVREAKVCVSPGLVRGHFILKTGRMQVKYRISIKSEFQITASKLYINIPPI